MCGEGRKRDGNLCSPPFIANFNQISDNSPAEDRGVTHSDNSHQSVYCIFYITESNLQR